MSEHKYIPQKCLSGSNISNPNLNLSVVQKLPFKNEKVQCLVDLQSRYTSMKSEQRDSRNDKETNQFSCNDNEKQPVNSKSGYGSEIFYSAQENGSEKGRTDYIKNTQLLTSKNSEVTKYLQSLATADIQNNKHTAASSVGNGGMDSVCVLPSKVLSSAEVQEIIKKCLLDEINMYPIYSDTTEFVSKYSTIEIETPEEIVIQSIETQTVDGSSVFLCKRCGKISEKKTDAIEHARTKHFPYGYKCRVCGSVLKSVSSLHSHILQQHKRRQGFQCSLCDKIIKAKSNLKIHMKTHDTNRKRFSCTKCEKSFSEQHALRQHVRDFHSGEKGYFCTYCSRSFGTTQAMQRHRETHKTVKDEICTICGAAFKAKKCLRIHKLRAHSTSAHTCPECRKVYKSEFSLIKHKKRCHSHKYICEFCGKCLANKESLTGHIRIHSGEKPYQCDICGSCFARHPNYKQHMLYHSGIKKFICDICDGKFSRKSFLRVHVEKVHCKVT